MARTKMDIKKNPKGKGKGTKEPLKKKKMTTTVPTAEVLKKQRRWKHKTIAMRNIRKDQMQSDNKFACRPTVFFRAVKREITNSHRPDTRVTRNAMFLLQQAVESVMGRILVNANMLCVCLTNKVTLNTEHVYAALKVMSDGRDSNLALDYHQQNPDAPELKQLGPRFSSVPTPSARKVKTN